MSLMLALMLCAPADAAWKWSETVSPHFVVKHESPWMPPGFTLKLENMHTRLRMDLSMFSPWMGKERLNLYLYKERKSYVGGEFTPPEWSNGLAIVETKTVVVYDQKEDRKKLLEVIAHETTHLLFESYWAEVKKEQPPTWLNEGLAMISEGSASGRAGKSDWYQTMVYWDPAAFMPVRGFLETVPTKDMKDNAEGDKAVAAWYVQAYSLVYFLFKGHQSPLQFKTFCAKVRDGEDLEKSLGTAYHYRSIAQLEKAWKAWLADPKLKRGLEASASLQPAAPGTATPIESKGFESFRR